MVETLESIRTSSVLFPLLIWVGFAFPATPGIGAVGCRQTNDRGTKKPSPGHVLSSNCDEILTTSLYLSMAGRSLAAASHIVQISPRSV